MSETSLSSLDRALAKICVACPLCRRARRQQAGLAFQLVQKVEEKICPFCRAYERVYGRKSPPGVATFSTGTLWSTGPAGL